MRHSKLFASLVMAGVSACALTSCDDNKVDIVFYSSAGDTNVPLIQGVVDRFNETSEYKVGVENPGGGYDGVKEAVIADISAGTVPAHPWQRRNTGIRISPRRCKIHNISWYTSGIRSGNP